ncbi:GSHB-like protein [Mya arenaria]|uniref:Glutathione synthetase n=1 Tax=Mya arenaria TaxID=6604 RepID=A0ABY7G6D7_MYAAR|nr:GSHB-like protein [Mya arenaria]
MRSGEASFTPLLFMMDYHSDMIAEDVVGEMIRRVTGMAMLVLPVDDFTQEFWNIYNTVREEGPAQEITLTLSRDDFMMEPKADGSKGQDVKQVEFNTFASGAGGVIGAMRDVHRDDYEVAVVYYRYGYSPKHYPTRKEYDLRLKMERSRAIKCPSMASHLAGCKKIQQVLAEPRVLERFISDPVTVAEIRSVFVGLYRLNQDGSSSAVIEKALANPDQFVMKPQREGGGNNHFGAELKSFLEKIKNTQELSSWILMDRIRVVEHRNRLIRVGLGPECRDVCSELGIFGVHLSTPGEELENFECGCN